ncbi:betaine/proline/choline family ABC transporter ATP-binding protein [Bacillus gobiensis]|uniref:betaine/proline/choline family ABC transporter ATP-binding protein n=1 Tax=Bacillus gobiensis TaxID=1441095 RepID=UPI003D19D3EF
MSEISVEFQNVTKRYGSSIVLENFNLVIPKGKISTIIGPSGCGKTTILKMINKLIKPDGGSIFINEKDISKLDSVKLRRNIGYVIQQIGLFPHMTIEENISVVSRLQGKSKRQLSQRVEELLELIGLDPSQFRKRYPFELSGGQQQRIGVARALASDPSIVLMDEPFSALDPISRVQLQKELIKLNEQLKKTIIFVTHDIDEALKIADHVILVQKGKIVQNDSPTQILERPKNEFVREFIGQERFPSKYPSETVINVKANGISIFNDSPISKVADSIQKDSVEGLVVIDHNQTYLGMVNINELKNHLSENQNLQVKDIMRTTVPYITPHTPVADVFSLLEENEILPVVNKEKKLEGVVAKSSVIQGLEDRYHKEEVI